MEARLVAGRYQLIRPLGRGGMGAVWLGEDQLAGRQVAVKELRPPAGDSPEDQDVFRRRALSEARSAARLTHPNAVTLYDVIPASPADDAVYLIMEYIAGASLAQLIAERGPLSEPRTAEIALQLLSVLDAAHALGIVHRDIKPANIMITPAGQVKLTDFGIAHMVGGTRLTSGGVVGTPAYMAPEQLQGFDLTPAVDCWALGVTLYDAVTGHNPFDRSTTVATFHAILMAELPSAPCGPPLADVISGLLVRDPAQRMTTERARASLAGDAAPERQADPGVPVPPAVPPPGPTMPGAAWSPGPGGTAVATHPAAFPGQPAAPSPRRRRGVLIGAGAAVAAVIAAVITVIALPGSGGHPAASTGSSGTDIPTTTAITATATTSPAATDTPTPASSASASGAPSSGAATLPQAYLGQWSGTITANTGAEGPQTAKLNLTGGAVNSVVGTVSYSNGPCTYNLVLVSSSGSGVGLQEQVTSGPCFSDYAIMKLSGGKLTEDIHLISPAGPPDLTGTLAKTS
jgi:tRNA A-37 threonylcarbamoyl transferase component Bud32